MILRNIIPDNSLLQSTFLITYSDSSGTCFQYVYLVGKVGNIFLVTARHLFPDVAYGTRINFNITTENVPKAMTGTIYFHLTDKVDIAVIKVNEPLTLYFRFQHGPFSIGQESFFCGFPFGLRMDSVGINHGFPLPIVKKAMISAYSHSLKQYTFDGHNNKGFSGSPIGFHDIDSKQTFIIGVVCAYYPQHNTLKIAGEDYSYTENSGIFIAYSFTLVGEIIDVLKNKSLLDTQESLGMKE